MSVRVIMAVKALLAIKLLVCHAKMPYRYHQIVPVFAIVGIMVPVNEVSDRIKQIQIFLRRCCGDCGGGSFALYSTKENQLPYLVS